MVNGIDWLSSFGHINCTSWVGRRTTENGYQDCALKSLLIAPRELVDLHGMACLWITMKNSWMVALFIPMIGDRAGWRWGWHQHVSGHSFHSVKRYIEDHRSKYLNLVQDDNY